MLANIPTPNRWVSHALVSQGDTLKRKHKSAVQRGCFLLFIFPFFPVGRPWTKGLSHKFAVAPRNERIRFKIHPLPRPHRSAGNCIALGTVRHMVCRSGGQGAWIWRNGRDRKTSRSCGGRLKSGVKPKLHFENFAAMRFRLESAYSKTFSQPPCRPSHPSAPNHRAKHVKQCKTQTKMKKHSWSQLWVARCPTWNENQLWPLP